MSQEHDAVLRGIADLNPLHCPGYTDDRECFFCHREQPRLDDPSFVDTGIHEPTCLWVRANHLADHGRRMIPDPLDEIRARLERVERACFPLEFPIGAVRRAAPKVKPAVLCPECGGESFIPTPDRVLTSNPPKRNATCKRCGHQFFVPA